MTMETSTGRSGQPRTLRSALSEIFSDHCFTTIIIFITTRPRAVTPRNSCALYILDYIRPPAFWPLTRRDPRSTAAARRLRCKLNYYYCHCSLFINTNARHESFKRRPYHYILYIYTQTVHIIIIHNRNNIQRYVGLFDMILSV